MRQGIWKVVIVFVAIALVVSVGWAVGLNGRSAVEDARSHGGPVTEEQAKEISAFAELVKKCRGFFNYFSEDGAEFHDASWVALVKTGHAGDHYKDVPDGHSIYLVFWSFADSASSADTCVVIVTVDADTGAIVHERYGLGTTGPPE